MFHFPLLLHVHYTPGSSPKREQTHFVGFATEIFHNAPPTTLPIAAFYQFQSPDRSTYLEDFFRLIVVYFSPLLLHFVEKLVKPLTGPFFGLLYLAGNLPRYCTGTKI
jgi:hypothetical protein